MQRESVLAADELTAIAESAALASPPHLFLCNQLRAEAERIAGGDGEPTGRFYGVFGPGGLELVAFFGTSRVCVLGPGRAAAALALRATAVQQERGFRILIGPVDPAVALLDALRPKVRIELDRSQPFLCVTDASRLTAEVAFRAAGRSDLEWLTQASLQLNEEDLGIPAYTVDQHRLRDRIEQRLGEGRTFIVETGGRPASKLEVGNEGPAGALIEGVYTEPRFRGCGLARGLVAGVSRRLLERWPRVGLHVGRGNAPALRAYQASGFEEVADLRLALMAWR
jgi:GNAT superfamily N-acetyltransferase